MWISRSNIFAAIIETCSANSSSIFAAVSSSFGVDEQDVAIDRIEAHVGKETIEGLRADDERHAGLDCVVVKCW
jgi:hypothetical protein